MTEVTGIDVVDGRVRRVRTDKGDIEAEVVVIACGVWSPWIGAMAGAAVPLTPAVHQMISVGPVPLFATTVGEIEYPIVRDMDTNMYERQHGGDLEVGSYAHQAIIVEADDIPSIARSALSPTELPFTEDDFELQMEQALELVPDILGDERVGIRHKINGLLSLTPDGMPILGETPEVKGLWVSAAVWIKEGPGIARMVAEWMTDGQPEIDPHGSDIARFHAHQTARHHVKARSAEGFNKTYGIVHPAEQWESNRDVRLQPVQRPRTRARRGVLRDRRLERPFWYASNELLEEYGDRVMPARPSGIALVVADHQRRAPRHARPGRDGRPVGVRDLRHQRPRCTRPRPADGRADGRAGRAVYTPLLNEAGGIKVGPRSCASIATCSGS